MCALHLTHPSAHTVNTHPEQWSANAVALGEQLGVRCLAQGSHLSRGIEGGRECWLFTPKSKRLDNWDCLGFWGIKKMEWIFIIVGWLCLHTAKIHLYANEDILHPMSPLKLKYYNLFFFFFFFFFFWPVSSTDNTCQYICVAILSSFTAFFFFFKLNIYIYTYIHTIYIYIYIYIYTYIHTYIYIYIYIYTYHTHFFFLLFIFFFFFFLFFFLY